MNTGEMSLSAAFFDIDRTLVVGASLESFFLGYLWQRREIGLTALWRNAIAGLQAWGILPAKRQQRIAVPAGLPLLTRLRYTFLSGNKAFLRGLSLETCRSLAKTVFQQEILPRLSPKGEARLHWHQRCGHLVVLLTGTLDFLGEPLQHYLGADYLLASRPEVRDGWLTGRLAEPHPYGTRKRDLVHRLAREKHLDLDICYAYADHHTDVPILETVGHPVAVNPDHLLANVAQERGWSIESW